MAPLWLAEGCTVHCTTPQLTIFCLLSVTARFDWCNLLWKTDRWQGMLELESSCTRSACDLLYIL